MGRELWPSIALSVGISESEKPAVKFPCRRIAAADPTSPHGASPSSLPPSPSFVHSTLWIVTVIDVDTKTLFPQIAIVIQPSIIHVSQVRRPSVS